MVVVALGDLKKIVAEQTGKNRESGKKKKKRSEVGLSQHDVMDVAYSHKSFLERYTETGLQLLM